MSAEDTKIECFALIVPPGVVVRRVYAGGVTHTFQVGRPWRFWGDTMIPSIIDQFCKQFCTVWDDVVTRDGAPLSTTQLLFGPHVAGLNAFGLPISHFTAPAWGPMTLVSLVPLSIVPHCNVRTVNIPRWAIESQRPPAADNSGPLIPID